MATWRPAGEPTLTCKGYERVTSRVEQNGTEICRRCGFKLVYILLTIVRNVNVTKVRNAKLTIVTNVTMTIVINVNVTKVRNVNVTIVINVNMTIVSNVNVTIFRIFLTEL